MNRRIRTAAAIGTVLLAGGLLTACQSDSSKVSDNLSTEAEQFRVTRQITFYNGITDKYIAVVKGRCSVDTAGGVPAKTLAVTCKTGPNSYIKDYLGLSDNVTWFSIQTQGSSVSPYHYEIIFKPANVIPSFTGSDATP